MVTVTTSSADARLLVIAGVSLLATMALTLRDDAVGSLASRLIACLAWPAVGALTVWRGRFTGMTWNELAISAICVYLLVCVSTLGRPALIMEQILTSKTRRDPRLMRRSRYATAATLGSLVLLAAFMEFRP